MKSKKLVALLLSMSILALGSCSSKIFNQINNFNNGGSIPQTTETPNKGQDTYTPSDNYPENDPTDTSSASTTKDTSSHEDTTRIPDTTATPSIHTHAFGAWNTITAPTCTTEGAQVRSCSCGEMESRKTTALGHSTVQIPGKSATCSSTGLTNGEKCTVCGTYTIQQQTVDKLSHDFSQWKTEKEATCSTDGKKTRTCKNCTQTETEIIKSSGSHNYVHGICSACSTVAEGSSFLTYELSEDGTYYICTGVKSIYSTYEECIIPGTYKGKPVKKIISKSGSGVSFGDIKKLTIMEGVEDIQNYAFESQDKLQLVYLPRSLKKISVGAFMHCSQLEEIHILTSGWEKIFMPGSPNEQRTAMDFSDPYLTAEMLRRSGSSFQAWYMRE